MSDIVKRDPAQGALQKSIGQDDGEINVQKHIHLVRRNLWLIVLCFVAVFSYFAVKTYKAVPVYEATARLLIERRVPQMAALGQTGQGRDEKYYSTQIKLLTSKAVLEKALKNEEVAEAFTKEEKQISQPEEGLLAGIRRELSHLVSEEQARPTEPWERLRSVVSVRPVQESDLVEVTVEGHDPEKAARIANAVSRAYVDYSIAMEKENAGEVFELLQRQMKEQEDALEDAEDRLIEYREKTNVAELGGDIGSSQGERKRLLDEERTAVQMQRIELSVAAEDIEDRREQGAAGLDLLAVDSVRSDAGVRELMAAREKASLERKAAMRALGARHPEVLAYTDQLEYVESRLRNAIEHVADGIEAKHAMLAKREKDLREALAEEDEAALERARQAQVYQRLERDAQRQTRVFEVIVDRMKEVDLIKDEGITNVSLIEKAVAPARPVAPNKKRNLIMGAFLGLMLGLGLTYGLSYLDDTVNNPSDVEDTLGMPWLGHVPKMRKGDISDMAQAMLRDPSGACGEAFRTIRTNIYFSGQHGSMKTIMTTSSTPGEGKTVFSSNLAAAIAHQGKRVLLVDADLRRPMIHKAFELNRKDGLTNLLVQNARLEDIVQSPANGSGPILPNLHVVTAGSKAPNPAELLVGNAMRRFMEKAREEYDMVIYDSCPAMFLADNAALASACDGVAMVVAAGETKTKAVQTAHRQLTSVEGTVIGVVLNKVKAHEMKYYGSYGSYYYYSYDYYYEDYTDDDEIEELDTSSARQNALPEDTTRS